MLPFFQLPFLSRSNVRPVHYTRIVITGYTNVEILVQDILGITAQAGTKIDVLSRSETDLLQRSTKVYHHNSGWVFTAIHMDSWLVGKVQRVQKVFEFDARSWDVCVGLCHFDFLFLTTALRRYRETKAGKFPSRWTSYLAMSL